VVKFEDVAEFSYRGERIPLLDPQRGIRKPKGLSAALSIRTVHSAYLSKRPYDDDVGGDGYLRYKWRGTDPNHPENRALRNAMELRLPVIWFQGIGTGAYVPTYPVWLLAEEEYQHQFVVALSEQQRASWEDPDARAIAEAPVEYGLRLVKQRLQQPMFRGQVILAYRRECALCHLRHVELLDAAHIKSDAEGGQPIVQNGIAMCKIHHAAFDANIIGVTPDYVVQVRPDVLAETDGPMLTHALQEVHDKLIQVPGPRRLRPDTRLLDERYKSFVGAA
jgi:putative restriction endonuclease